MCKGNIKSYLTLGNPKTLGEFGSFPKLHTEGLYLFKHKKNQTGESRC